VPAKIATTSDTEGELEAEIRAAVEWAFPWLNASEIKHQTTFSFKFGHSNVTVDGTPKDAARGRADVLLLHQGVPLTTTLRNGRWAPSPVSCMCTTAWCGACWRKPVFPGSGRRHGRRRSTPICHSSI
jgi:hypothetical protein